MSKTDVTMAAIFSAIGIVLAVLAYFAKSTVATWIWGILAVAVFAFTIYATIDAIVKNKRRPKDLADLLARAMAEEVKKPDFSARMEEAGKRRNLLFDGQRTSDPNYGYSADNPVMTSTVSRSDEYLNRLRTLDGKPFTWNRTGSLCMREVHGVPNVMVDIYVLFLDGQEYKTLYICPYGHSADYVPDGLTLA